MKKVIVITLISSMLASTAYAGNVPGGILNPLWLPATILSTLAVTIAPAPVVYEQRPHYVPQTTVVYRDPRPVVVYENRRHSHDRYYERQSCDYGERRGWSHEAPRYREYR